MKEIVKRAYGGGNVYYTNEKGKYHNINDEPAIIFKNGGKHWYKNGNEHRTKGPAKIYSSGILRWYYEGNNITDKVNQLMDEGKLNPDWENWTEEDEFLFVLLVS